MIPATIALNPIAIKEHEEKRRGAPDVAGTPQALSGMEQSAYGAALTIDSVVKNDLSTAPMLMYQHSRSGVFCAGR